MGHEGSRASTEVDATVVRNPAETTQASRRQHVLVIEDEPNISEAIRFILQRDGLEVTVLSTGDSALSTISKLQPSLIILDVMLPGVSGFDILQQMRANPDLSTIPVILLTANGQAAAREKAAHYGASRFMAKPFSNADLLGAVRELVQA